VTLRGRHLTRRRRSRVDVVDSTTRHERAARGTARPASSADRGPAGIATWLAE